MQRLQVTVSLKSRKIATSNPFNLVGPWPFLDVGDEIDPERLNNPDNHIPMTFAPCIHKKFKEGDVCWCKYPQALYPNWTLSQQKKSKIVKVIEKTAGTCTVHYVDVLDDGTFVSTPSQEVRESTVDAYWGIIQQEVGSGS